MDETRATELRERLGYTRADLLILLNVLGLPEDRAGELPLFPPAGDVDSRKRIYEFTLTRGRYAPVFAWGWRLVKVSAPPRKRSSEIYAYDHAAHQRHRASRVAQILLYEAIRANEAYIAGKTPHLQAIEAKKCFCGQLAELAKTIKSGEWGEPPPPDVLGILPSDPPTAKANNPLSGYVTAGMAAAALYRTYASLKLNQEATATKLRQRLRKAEGLDFITPDNRGTKAYHLAHVLDVVKAHCAASRKLGSMQPGDVDRFIGFICDALGDKRNPE